MKDFWQISGVDSQSIALFSHFSSAGQSRMVGRGVLLKCGNCEKLNKPCSIVMVMLVLNIYENIIAKCKRAESMQNTCKGVD